MPTKIALYLGERLRAIEKFLGDDADTSRCEVEIGQATGRHRHSDYQWFVEIQVKRPGAGTTVARNQEPTVNAAIDMAKAELIGQLRKKKTVRTRKVRKDAARAKRMLRG